MTSDDIQELAHEVAFWMQGLDEPLPALDEHASLVRQLCGQLRSLAIMVLLHAAKTDRFHHNLIRSGRLRLAFLERCASEGAVHEHDFVSGVVEPVHDAMAAGDWPLAMALVRTAPATYRPGHEYEDDHHHVQLLGQLMAGDAAAAAAALQHYVRSIGGEPDARAAVFEALIAGDPRAFDTAFECLVEARLAEIRHEVARGGLSSPSVLAPRHLFIEGVALLGLARRLGLQPADDYRLCPALALVPMQEPLPDSD